MMIQKVFVFLLLTASAVLFTCGVVRKAVHVRASENCRKVVAVVPVGAVNTWWVAVRKGAEQAGMEENVEIIWNGPEVDTDREKQIQIVEDLLSQNVDAVVLAPGDAAALVRSVHKVKDRGIPCIIIDSPVKTERYDAFAGTDGYAAGCIAARLAGKALKDGKGNALIIRYLPTIKTGEDRANGFIDTLKKEFPGVRILGDIHTAGSVDDARQKTTDLLTRFPETDLVYGVNQPSAVGAYKAVVTRETERKVVLIAFDSDPVLLKGVEDGDVKAIISQNPFQIGYTGVKMAARRLRGEEIRPRKVSTPILVINRENLQEMKAKYPDVLGL